MTDGVDIMSAKQYFRKYGIEGVGKGADRWMIKRQLIDAFRKEAFGLIMLRLKTPDDISVADDPETVRMIRNVIKDTMRKWQKLCGIFSMYRETKDLIEMGDLNLMDEDMQLKIMTAREKHTD